MRSCAGLLVLAACSGSPPAPVAHRPDKQPLDTEMMIRAFPSTTDVIVSADMQKLAASSVARDLWLLVQAEPTGELTKLTGGFCVRSLASAARVVVGVATSREELWAWGAG